MALVFLGATEERRGHDPRAEPAGRRRGQAWHLLTAGAFVTMVAAAARVPGPAALLRARHPRRAPSRADAWRDRRRRRGEDDVLGQLLPAFDGHASRRTGCCERVAAGQAHGATVFLRANARDADSLASLAWQLHACRAGRPAAAHRRRPGGRPAGRPGPRDDALPGRHGPRRGRRRGPHRGGRRAPPATSCGRWASPSATRRSATWPSSRGNVSLGTRAFGSDPAHVARHAAALTRGLQAGGVVATAKHFPGFGAVDVDPHHRLGVVEAHGEVLEARELVPFRAAIAAGARMVMSAHVALPAVTGDRALPATVSRAVMHGLLRGELGFRGRLHHRCHGHEGGGAGQRRRRGQHHGAARRRGPPAPDPRPRRAATPGGRAAPGGPARPACRRPGSRASLSPASGACAAGWRASSRPTEASCGARRIARLARRAAAAAITLVRDEAGLLPLRPAPGERIVVITPQPARPHAGRFLG